jgi:hypothetical protein
VLWGKSYQQFITSFLAENPCYLTSSELLWLHRRFGHLFVKKLHALLKRSGYNTTTEAIARLTKFCQYCQKHRKLLGRFKFCLSNNTINFNHLIYINVMYINSKPALHVINKATRFSAACFLQDILTKTT